MKEVANTATRALSGLFIASQASWIAFFTPVGDWVVVSSFRALRQACALLKIWCLRLFKASNTESWIGGFALSAWIITIRIDAKALFNCIDEVQNILITGESDNLE